VFGGGCQVAKILLLGIVTVVVLQSAAIDGLGPVTQPESGHAPVDSKVLQILAPPISVEPVNILNVRVFVELIVEGAVALLKVKIVLPFGATLFPPVLLAERFIDPWFTPLANFCILIVGLELGSHAIEPVLVTVTCILLTVWLGLKPVKLEGFVVQDAAYGWGQSLLKLIMVLKLSYGSWN
jgi:hypothetical protein